VNSLNDDQRLTVSARTEREYYDFADSRWGAPAGARILVSIIMAVGSSFAAMNTMYAAVARRAREIGNTARAGVFPCSILTSFFLESVC